MVKMDDTVLLLRRTHMSRIGRKCTCTVSEVSKCCMVENNQPIDSRTTMTRPSTNSYKGDKLLGSHADMLAAIFAPSQTSMLL